MWLIEGYKQFTLITLIALIWLFSVKVILLWFYLLGLLLVDFVWLLTIINVLGVIGGPIATLYEYSIELLVEVEEHQYILLFTYIGVFFFLEAHFILFSVIF